jgi:hypothetical protein
MTVAKGFVASMLSSSPLSQLPIATSFIRKMRGGTQSALIRCADGMLYVVKFRNNEQGPNVLANEVMGLELLCAVGLPTPKWRGVILSQAFIDLHPEMWISRAGGVCEPPAAGMHFGSLFLAQDGSRELFEVLPGAYLTRILNRRDFLGIYIFDVWANHCDTRQPLFVKPTDSRMLNAVFIDNGHLFGGPNWETKRRPGRSRCMDSRVYANFEDEDIEEWISHFERTLSPALQRLARTVPKIWYSGDLDALLEGLHHRQRSLRVLFSEEIKLTKGFKPNPLVGLPDGEMSVRSLKCVFR